MVDCKFLIEVAEKLLIKGEIVKTRIRKEQSLHLIYSFIEDNMRPHYPMESDYAATLRHVKSKGPSGRSLELYGEFADEYN